MRPHIGLHVSRWPRQDNPAVCVSRAYGAAQSILSGLPVIALAGLPAKTRRAMPRRLVKLWNQLCA